MNFVVLFAGLQVVIRGALRACVRPASRDSAGRACALVHGVCAWALLARGDTGDAIAATGMFFVLDGVFNWLSGLESRANAAHHVIGALLCGFALAADSWRAGHVFEPMTRAFITMEITNPLLHVAVLVRNEAPTVWARGLVRAPLKAALLAAWLKFRIWDVGRELGALVWHVAKIDFFWTPAGPPLLALGISMVGLQVWWLGKLVGAAKNT